MKAKRAFVIVLAVLVLAALACSETGTKEPTPTPGIGKLWCPDCAEEDMAINLWEKGEAERGKVVAKGEHGDEVQVLEKKHDATEDRFYYRVRVTSTGATGWVPETLIQVE